MILIKYTIVSNNITLKDYNDYYFNKYPKRKKKPIEKPYHPSVNKWFILPRPQMNKLKQDWKEYIIWLVEQNGFTDLHIEKCRITYRFYMPSKRRSDTDNYTPKFCQDGLVEAGVIVDDDYLHCNPLKIWLGYDKNNPRMEITIEEL